MNPSISDNTNLATSQAVPMLISSMAGQFVKKAGRVIIMGGDSSKRRVKQESNANPAVDSLFALQCPSTVLRVYTNPC